MNAKVEEGELEDSSRADCPQSYAMLGKNKTWGTKMIYEIMTDGTTLL